LRATFGLVGGKGFVVEGFVIEFEVEADVVRLVRYFLVAFITVVEDLGKRTGLTVRLTLNSAVGVFRIFLRGSCGGKGTVLVSYLCWLFSFNIVKVFLLLGDLEKDKGDGSVHDKLKSHVQGKGEEQRIEGADLGFRLISHKILRVVGHKQGADGDSEDGVVQRHEPQVDPQALVLPQDAPHPDEGSQQH